MENLNTYRNKRARLHVLAGAHEYQPTVAAGIINAANERIQARKVEPGEVLLGSNGKVIPEGYYAVWKDEGYLETIVAVEPTFFDSLWELDTPRTL